ncbi:MAG: tRNA (adenine(22)-N(1))-methyltransferase [Candidatus Enteromonas sp.]
MARKLSKRLQTIADLVEPGCFLADVGSDHALLPIHLVQSGKISWAMAIENKIGPFLHMSAAIKDAELNAKIFASKSDGISVLADGVNALAVCGMGGLLSCKILESHPENLQNIQSIVLDPHRDLEAVRRRVTALGYYIDDERMVYEDKIYYSIIRFKKGKPSRPYALADYLFGPILRKRRDEVFLEWLEAQLKKINAILNKNLGKEARSKYLALYRLVRDEIAKK